MDKIVLTPFETHGFSIEAFKKRRVSFFGLGEGR
jgi:hypothetical protein